MFINFHSKDLLDLFCYLILNGLSLVMMLYMEVSVYSTLVPSM